MENVPSSRDFQGGFAAYLMEKDLHLAVQVHVLHAHRHTSLHGHAIEALSSLRTGVVEDLESRRNGTSAIFYRADERFSFPNSMVW